MAHGPNVEEDYAAQSCVGVRKFFNFSIVGEGCS